MERAPRWWRTFTMYAGLVEQYVLKPRHGVPYVLGFDNLRAKRSNQQDQVNRDSRIHGHLS
jgi:hypothetical protein